MSVAISIIVPVYNVEKTLDRCMQSILNQTFKDYEIILVNYGSNDNSAALCDEYAKKHDNIRVIHKENEGLGPSRNAGILAAMGEYIYHCDSDDWLKPDLLEKSYNAIVEKDADVLVFGYDLFYEKNSKILSYGTVSVDDAYYDNNGEIRQFFVNQYFNSFSVLSAWNRLYKRSFIIENEIFFPPLRRCQDMAYSLLLFDKVNKLVTLKDTFYCYIIEPGVFKGRTYNEMLEIYYTIYETTSEYFKKWSLFDETVKTKLTNYICESIANYSSYAFIIKYPQQFKDNARTLLKDKRLTELFLRYKNNKGSKFMLLFSLGMKLKSTHMLLLTAKLSQKIQGNSVK